MKNKVFLIVLTLIIITSYSLKIQAEDVFRYKEEGYKLHRLYWDCHEAIAYPEYTANLEMRINREIGLARFLISYDIFTKPLTNSEVKEILADYSDANMISDWAKEYWAYAIKNKLVVGIERNKLGPKEAFTGTMFSAITLRYLGYNLDVSDYSNSIALLYGNGEMTQVELWRLKSNALIVDDLYGLQFGLLKRKCLDGRMFIEKMVEEKVYCKNTAIEFGLLK